MKEIWKPVVGYEGLYEISNKGRVKSLYKYKGTTQRILSPRDNQNGYHYLSVSLYKNKSSHHKYIHRLVAQAFIPNPKKKSQINHIDNNTLNNNSQNLEWCTPKENSLHRKKYGRGASRERHGMSKLYEKDIIKIRKSKLTQEKIASIYNVSRSNISMIKNNKTWKS